VSNGEDDSFPQFLNLLVQPPYVCVLIGGFLVQLHWFHSAVVLGRQLLQNLLLCEVLEMSLCLLLLVLPVSVSPSPLGLWLVGKLWFWCSFLLLLISITLPRLRRFLYPESLLYSISNKAVIYLFLLFPNCLLSLSIANLFIIINITIVVHQSILLGFHRSHILFEKPYLFLQILICQVIKRLNLHQINIIIIKEFKSMINFLILLKKQIW